VAGELILVVDDSPPNLRLVQLLLSSEGYNVVTAQDAEQAIEILGSRRPRLILMDVQLPGMDGLELTRRIKANPATRDIVIIALTAYAMKGDSEKALAAGCDDYLSKPIDTKALPKVIADRLNVKDGTR
jgi:two-component system, cell cycle response regulator DivK